MRTKNILRNVIVSTTLYLLSAVLAFGVRKAVAYYLGNEVLGYEGLFGNFFTLLSLADLGVGTIIAYRMYPAFATEDRKRIAHLLSVYKWLYRWVALIVLCIGLAVLPFLKYIVKENTLSSTYLIAIYMLHIGGTLCSYLLAYKRIMLEMDQRESECVKVDTVCSTISGFLQILTAVLFESYFLYLLMRIANNLIANVYLSRKVDREYTYLLKDEKITYQDIRDLGIARDIGNTFVHKMCRVIHSSTDNIIISAVLGITHVGAFDSYIMVHSFITSVIVRILKPIRASVGNLNYSSEQGKSRDVFYMFNLFSFWIACFIACGYVALLEPLIEVWLGHTYLLPSSVTISLSVCQYVTLNGYFVQMYRDTMGKYELDRIWAILAVLFNLVLSLWLIRLWGLTGILIGTMVGSLCFFVGSSRVVFSEFIHERVGFYFLRQAQNLLIFGAELTVMVLLVRAVDHCQWGMLTSLIAKALLTILVPNCINLLLFFKTKEVSLMQQYGMHMMRLIAARLRKDDAHS